MTLPQLTIPQAASQAELAALRARIHQARQQAASLADANARPFLVITPLGLPLAGQLLALLSARGIAMGSSSPLANWPRAASVLYSQTEDDERLRVALGFERVWQALSIAQHGLRCDFASLDAYAQFLPLKNELRAALGGLALQVSFPDVVIRAPGQVIHLQAFHAPDAGRWAEESRLLDIVGSSQ